MGYVKFISTSRRIKSYRSGQHKHFLGFLLVVIVVVVFISGGLMIFFCEIFHNTFRNNRDHIRKNAISNRIELNHSVEQPKDGQKRLCPVIWSHRGHADSSSVRNQNYTTAGSFSSRNKSTNWTCAYALKELHKENIRHFDMDVLLQQNLLDYDREKEVLVVAHPAEFSIHSHSNPNVPVSSSPCSKITLKQFEIYLRNEFSPEQYYFTMEPKAGLLENFLDSTNVKSSPLLSLLEKLAEYLKGRDFVSNKKKNCGIILEHWQSQTIYTNVVKQLNQYCDMVLPLRRNSASLMDHGLISPVSSFIRYDIIMPSIELFTSGNHGKYYMEQSLLYGYEVVVWIVDELDTLITAIEYGTQGIVTNSPLLMASIIRESKACELS